MLVAPGYNLLDGFQHIVRRPKLLKKQTFSIKSTFIAELWLAELEPCNRLQYVLAIRWLIWWSGRQTRHSRSR